MRDWSAFDLSVLRAANYGGSSGSGGRGPMSLLIRTIMVRVSELPKATSVIPLGSEVTEYSDGSRVRQEVRSPVACSICVGRAPGREPMRPLKRRTCLAPAVTNSLSNGATAPFWLPQCIKGMPISSGILGVTIHPFPPGRV